MADIYLYVPCNGTKYYTGSNITSSEFIIYGGNYLSSSKSGNHIYTNYTTSSLNIKNSGGLPWTYSIEWWQRKSSSTGPAAVMMLSAGQDSTKLQLQDRYSNGALSFTFENRPGSFSYNANLSDSITNFDNDSWTHFAYVFNGTAKRAYYFMNGVYKQGVDIEFPDTEPALMYMLCAGGKSSSLSSAEEFFCGDVSDIVVYSGVQWQENTSFTPPTESPNTTGLTPYGQESYISSGNILKSTASAVYNEGKIKLYKDGKVYKAHLDQRDTGWRGIWHW